MVLKWFLCHWFQFTILEVCVIFCVQPCINANLPKLVTLPNSTLIEKKQHILLGDTRFLLHSRCSCIICGALKPNSAWQEMIKWELWYSSFISLSFFNIGSSSSSLLEDLQYRTIYFHCIYVLDYIYSHKWTQSFFSLLLNFFVEST